MIIVFVLVSGIMYLIGDYFLFQDLTPSGAQFSLMIWANGTVKGFSLDTYINGFSHPENETIYSNECVAIAAGWTGYGNPSLLSIKFDKIISKEPILVTFTSFNNITTLFFESTTSFITLGRTFIILESPNVTKISTYFAAFAKNRLGIKVAFASNSYTVDVKGSTIGSDPIPHQKSWFLTTAIAFLAFCSISTTLITINLLFRFALKKGSNLFNSKILRIMYVISKNAPWRTLAMSIIMLAIYVFIGTGRDFIMLNYWNGVSLWAETLSSFLFHSGYNHLLGNIMVFILSGTAIELWLKGKTKLFWYFLLILLNVFISIMFFFIWRYPPVGASYWIIGQSVILGYYAYLNRSIFNLKSWKDFIFLLITGYCLLGSIYDYLISLVTSHGGSTEIELAVGHIGFAALCYVLASFFRKKLVVITEKKIQG